MSWYNPATWLKIVPEKSYTTLNGVGTKMELDTFGIGNQIPLYFPDNEKYVRLQERHFVLNNVINKLAKDLSNANFTDKSKKLPTQLLKKINNPNQFQSKEEFLKEFTIFTLSAGWSFIWKRWASYGMMDSLELININPDYAEVDELGATFEFMGKVYSVPKDEIIMFYDIKRLHLVEKGMSRVKPLRSQLMNTEYAQLAKGIQIANSGTTIVSPKATTGGNTIDEGLNTPITVMPTLPGSTPMRTQKDDMEDKLNNRGVENRIIVSTKGVDAVNLSAGLATVRYSDIVESDILSIYDTFSFPVELSPYGKESTYINKQTAEASLYDNEIIPLANNLIKSLNTEFEGYGVLEVDFNHVSAVTAKQSEINTTNQTIINMYATLLDKGAITIEEYKQILTDKGILIDKQ